MRHVQILYLHVETHLPYNFSKEPLVWRIRHLRMGTFLRQDAKYGEINMALLSAKKLTTVVTCSIIPSHRCNLVEVIFIRYTVLDCWLIIYFLLFSSECRQFMLLSLELLSDHLSLATAARAPPSVLGQHSRPLRLLLFRLLDETVSDDLQEVRKNYS